MRTCPKCGAGVLATDAQCMDCGTDLSPVRPSGQQTQAPQHASPTPQPTLAAHPLVQELRKPILFTLRTCVFGGCLTLLLLFGGCVLLLSLGGDNEPSYQGQSPSYDSGPTYQQPSGGGSSGYDGGQQYAPPAQSYSDPPSGGRVVYYAPYSGERYHSSPGCRGLSRAKSVDSCTKEEARARGLTPPGPACWLDQRKGSERP